MKRQTLQGRELLTVTIAALGVVFGDIGTSPLYAIKECFSPEHGVAPTQANVLGILSLVFWALTLVICIKYLVFILRADNHGEGGTMALLARLISRFKHGPQIWTRTIVILLGLFGTALLYGEGIITPAISVLSAIEGLEIATPSFKPMVVPLTVGILIVLFGVQRGGTARLAAIFGPVTLVWFLTIAAIGIPWIIEKPEVLFAVNPLHAVDFFSRNQLHGFFLLSSVVLCITGGEALYADMGHFGRKPIRAGWFAVVFPALLLNYFGQGALILSQGKEVLRNPFYSMVSGWLLYPLVALATAATIIASQALISGAFSLTQQAVLLGYLPRLSIMHTSRSTEGQIYVPRVNEFLMISCIALVLTFQSSSSLAAAYGLAVTGTMTITSLLFFNVLRHLWGWSWFTAGGLIAIFLTVDLAFFTSNITKLLDGGWIPLAIGLVLFTVMTTWSRGRSILSKAMLAVATPLDQFLDRIAAESIPRVKGTAVFMSLSRDIAPAVLLHHYRHNKVLHEKIILLTISTRHEPEVPALQRVRVTDLRQGFVKVVAWYGYMERPDISEIIELCSSSGLPININDLSFYLGRETFLTSGKSGIANWRKRLFVFLSRNARPATDFFGIPPDKVIEIGSQIQI